MAGKKGRPARRAAKGPQSILLNDCTWPLLLSLQT
jgi:hypothetical protein